MQQVRALQAESHPGVGTATKQHAGRQAGQASQELHTDKRKGMQEDELLSASVASAEKQVLFVGCCI